MTFWLSSHKEERLMQFLPSKLLQRRRHHPNPLPLHRLQHHLQSHMVELLLLPPPPPLFLLLLLLLPPLLQGLAPKRWSQCEDT